MAQEQRRRDRARHSPRRRIVEVGNAGLDHRVVGLPERHAPGRIAHLCRRVGQSCGQSVVVGVKWRKVGADSHPRRAGQRGHRHQQIGRLFHGQRQRIGQHQPPLGIGVVDLDRLAVARGQDVAGAETVGGHGVFHRRDQHPQPQGQFGGHDHPGQPQNGCRAAHVFLHQPHRPPGFQVQAAGVETHPLAHQRQGRTRLAPAQIDQARRTVRGTANGVDHGKIVLDQGLALGHGDVGAMGARQAFHRCLQLGRAHVGGGCVDQIAGQRLARGDVFQPRGIDARWRDKVGQRPIAGLSITLEPVSFQQPAQRGLVCGIAVKRALQPIGALGQLPPRPGNGKAFVGLPAQRRPRQAAVRSGQQRQLARARGKAGLIQPPRRHVRLAGQKIRQSLWPDQEQRARLGPWFRKRK